MPVSKSGFLVKHCEKIACGVVALGVLFALGYVAMRARSVSAIASPEQMAADLARIRSRLQQGGSARAQQAPMYADAVLRQFAYVERPATMPDNVIFPPLPYSYPPVVVGVDQEFELPFDAPLDRGSVRIEGDPDAVRLVEHPANGDYSRVLLKSGEEGKATVVGSAGGTRHERPVVVDARAGKTAHPPQEVTVTGMLGSVLLTIVPNPQNKDEGVEVASYEVWRRDWEDPLGEYHKVGNVQVGAGAGSAGLTGRTVGPAAAGMPPGAMMPPGAGFRGPTAARAGQQAGIQWQDLDVKAGERYSYKVRTVGANTYPPTSDFTDAKSVRVQSDADFRFSGSLPGKVNFEVAQRTERGVVRGQFSTTIGDEIGGVYQPPGMGVAQNLRTGAVLVDVQRSVVKPGGGISDRAIYADADGNLLIRWRKEEGSPALWAGQVGRGPMFGPPMGPMGPTGPTGRPPGVRIGRPTGGPMGARR